MTHALRRFGTYVLLGRLGEGAAGAAYLAVSRDPRLRVPSPLVLKLLHARFSEREEFVRRFRHEAEVAVRVDSAHVAEVYDAGAVGGEFYIGLEYVPGWTLSRLHSAYPRAWAPSLAVELVRQALLGLQALHDARDPMGRLLDFVHRDISPKNLMVDDNGRVVLIDLGLGRSNAQDWQTTAGRVMGSPGYMPIEQIERSSVDQRADIYALGVIFWELLTGVRYIPHDNSVAMLHATIRRVYQAPSLLRPDLPPALDSVVGRAMAVSPDQRYRSASEFLAAVLGSGVAPAGRAALARFSEHHLGADAAARKDEVARLLAQVETIDDPPDDSRTIVYARREQVAQTEEVDATLEPTAVGYADTSVSESTRLSPTRVLGVQNSASNFAVSASIPELAVTKRGVQAGLVLVLVLMAVAVGFAAGQAWTSGPPAPVAVQVRATDNEPPATDTKAPSAVPTIAEQVVVATSSPAPSRVTPSEPRVVRERPEPKRPRPEPPPAPAAVDVASLQSRATQLKNRLGEAHPARPEIHRFLGKLALVRAVRDPAALAEQLKSLDAELSRLEKE